MTTGTMYSYCSCAMVLLSVFYVVDAVGPCYPDTIAVLDLYPPVLLKSIAGHVLYFAATSEQVTNYDRATLYIAPDKEDMAAANLTTSLGKSDTNPTVTPIYLIQYGDFIKGNNYPGAFNVMYDHHPVKCSKEGILSFICDSELTTEAPPTFTISTKQNKPLSVWEFHECVSIAKMAYQSVNFNELTLPA